MSEITESDIIRAKRLRDEGASWKLIGKTLNHDPAGIRSCLDPIYRAKRLERNAEGAKMRRAERHAEGRLSRGAVVERIPNHVGAWHRHVDRLMEERDRRLSVPPTLDNLLNGTPVKGRSAADGWQQQGISELPRNGRPPNDARPKPWRPLLKGEAREAAE